MQKIIVQTLLLVLCTGLLAACDVFTSDTGPVLIPQTTLTLHYNDSSLVIQNAGDNSMNALSRLAFVRGIPNNGSDDYALDRLTNGSVTSGECYTMVRRGSEGLIVPACEGSNGTEVMTNVTGLFWKAEPVGATAFSVRWDGEVIAQCETFALTDTGTKQCTFTYPPEGATTGG